MRLCENKVIYLVSVLLVPPHLSNHLKLVILAHLIVFYITGNLATFLQTQCEETSLQNYFIFLPFNKNQNKTVRKMLNKLVLKNTFYQSYFTTS